MSVEAECFYALYFCVKAIDNYPKSDYNSACLLLSAAILFLTKQIPTYDFIQRCNMERNTLDSLKRFNQINKEADIIYHNFAKSYGLSDMAFWILYSMAETDGSFTQRDFCRDWFFAPQTVNSALKDLEKRDIIYLQTLPDNRKNKWIKLTEKGEAFMESTIVPLIRTECDSFEALSKEECELMLTATRKYVSALKEKVAAIEAENHQK